MLVRYQEVESLHPAIEWFISRMNERNYRYYASDLFRRISQTPDQELYAAIRRAIAILRLTGIPVQEHFTVVYRSGPSGIRHDWKISDLACSLIIMSYESPDAGIEELRRALMDSLGV